MADLPANPEANDEVLDPVDAELVAYLDGELDAASARRVEAKLARDPALQTRAAALKKTFDLLEFLPRPEPSPTFATRTLDKLPAVAKTAAGVAPSVAATLPHAPASSGPTPKAPSASLPLALGESSSHAWGSGRGWVWAFGVLFAAGLAIAGGYLGTAAARHYFGPRAKEQPATTPEDDPAPDRVIRYLPLYAAADNLDFVVQLADDLGFLEDNPASALGTSGEYRVPWVADLPALARAFKALPAERQAQIRLLDQQLHDRDDRDRDRLFRVLEAYTVWLDRLSDPERRSVLAATSSGQRLDEIRQIRKRQLLDSLPDRVRSEPDLEKRATLIKQWQKEEADRREDWAFVRHHLEMLRGGKVLWPFDHEDLKAKVLEYAREVLRMDEKDRARARLTPAEHAWLQESYEEGEKHRIWLWFGKAVYDLSRKYEMLPEPDGRPPLTEFAQLWPEARSYYTNKQGHHKRVAAHVGKWPDFALAVHEDLAQSKVPGRNSFSFGPARPGELAEPIRLFLSKHLGPALTPAERDSLKATEGRWPEYPRSLIKLAREHDLSVPGVMLPGKPSEWERVYGSLSGRPSTRKGTPG